MHTQPERNPPSTMPIDAANANVERRSRSEAGVRGAVLTHVLTQARSGACTRIHAGGHGADAGRAYADALGARGAGANNARDAGVDVRGRGGGAGVEVCTDDACDAAGVEEHRYRGRIRRLSEGDRGPSGIPTADDAHGTARAEVRGRGGAGTQGVEWEDGDGRARCLRTHPHGYEADVGERNPTADDACDSASVEVHGAVGSWTWRGVDSREGGSSKHTDVEDRQKPGRGRKRCRRRRRWSDLQERAAGDTALQAQFELDLYTEDQPEGGREGTNGNERTSGDGDHEREALPHPIWSFA
ncbi:hypothetical protein C8R45DRAFT_1134095 [Mycena sanguinolenta]|nr:hypothetical protein C8R45DRAFT_1134095 [Mycena sanguinolenta]